MDLLMLPMSLYILPTKDLAEDDNDVEIVQTQGWEVPPPAGAKLLIVPVDFGQLTRKIQWLYTVKIVKSTEDKEWPFDVHLRKKAVRQPQKWYDIVRESQIQGLIPLSGAEGEGEKIVHPPTIRLIYEMLGEA